MTGLHLDGSHWKSSLPERAPALVATVELTEPIMAIDAGDAAWAYLLVRVSGKIIGSITCPIINGQCQSAEIASSIVEALGERALHMLLADRLKQPILPASLQPQHIFNTPKSDRNVDLPVITVAVCTRNRPDALRKCLTSIAKQEYCSFEVIVVDNAPSTEDTRALVEEEFPQFRYIREDRAGLDWARNRALEEARGAIIAYTDDDIVADPVWLCHIVEAFEDSDVSAVTGLIAPFELRTDAQLAFEVIGGFGRGYRKSWYRVSPGRRPPDTYHLGAGRFGAGANMSFKLDRLKGIGGFDTALDVGTPTEGGGDLDIFLRMLHQGHTLVYEPSAIIYHVHRDTGDTLQAQIATWGTAIGALLSSAFIRYPHFRWRIVRFGLRWSWSAYLGPALRAFFGPGRLDRKLRIAPLARLAIGPWRYNRSRREQRAKGDAAVPAVRDIASANGGAIRIAHIDVSQPLVWIAGAGADTTHVRVNCGPHYLGELVVENRGHPISTAELRYRIADELGSALLAVAIPYSELAGLGSLKDLTRTAFAGERREFAPFVPSLVSVVIATRNRPEKLRRCLQSLASQRCAFDFEIVVVDNVPCDDGTQNVVRDFDRARYIREDVPGLAPARNTGFCHARGDILVATDDDVVAPPTWLSEIVQPFRFAHIGVTTGLILPLMLETPAQRDFEHLGGLNKGPKSFEVGIDWLSSRLLRPPRVWDLGATANSAYRRSMLEDPRVGLLPEALGPGTHAGGGEDCYHFYRALAAGYGLYYEPAAMLLHEHRVEDTALKRQMFDYARGHVAYLLTTLIDDRDFRALVRLIMILPVWHCWRLFRGGDGAARRMVVLSELRGYFYGAIGWWRGRRTERRLKRHGRDVRVLPAQADG